MTGAPAGAGGVPGWLAATLNFCSRCGDRLHFGPIAGEERDRLGCRSCGYICYVNPRLVVSTLPVTGHGELVLLRRGIEPAYGSWAQPGGFLEIDETAPQGAIRETLEETGLRVELTEIIGLYSRPEAAVVTAAYGARIVGGSFRTGPETLELRAFHPDRIPWDGIVLETSRWAIRDWVVRARPDLRGRL